MPRLREVDYTQIHLLPVCMEDWLPKDHHARFIREFVDTLNLQTMGFRIPEDTQEGRPTYAPALLLRLWLYGYHRKIRSVRNLERACRNEIGFIWLCGNRPPDHNSLWRFWQKNQEAFGALFKKTVRVAMDLNLIGFVLQAVDGTKIQAAAKGGECFDRKDLQTILGKLDLKIQELEGELQASAETEQPQIMDTLGDTKALKERIQKALEVIDQEGCKHVHPSEPEARRMRSREGKRFSYNAQIVVDQQKRILVAADVVNEANDMQQLNLMMEQAQANTASKSATMLADTGYASGQQLHEAAEKGQQVICPLPSRTRNDQEKPFHTSNFVYDEKTDEVICPEKKRLPFLRERERSGAVIRQYQSGKVCAGCPMREQCTKDRHGRKIEIAPWRKTVAEHRTKMKDPLNRALSKMRGEIVEVAFGWVKQMDGFRRWSVKGLDKVRSQWYLICAIVNLRTIYKSLKSKQRGSFAANYAG